MANTIRWGILGTGAIARSFAQDLKLLPEATLQAVGSRTTESAQAFARALGVATAHGSYDALVRDPQVDVVYIATPHVRHHDDSLLCLEAGKAVLCEKPFALNAAQARAVFTRAKEKNLFCMEAMWMRFQPLVLEARRLVQSGAIGTPRLLQADFGIAAPTDPTNRYFHLALGGGSLLDLGVYPLSLALFLLGAPEGMTSQGVLGATGVDEQSTLVLRYPNAGLAVLSASLRARTRAEAVLTGDEGCLTLHAPFYRPSRLTISRWPPAGPTAPPSGGGGRLGALVKGNPLLYSLYQRFGTSLRRGGEESQVQPWVGNGYQFEAAETMRCLQAGEIQSPLQTAEESLRLLEILDAARASWGLRYPQEG